MSTTTAEVVIKGRNDLTRAVQSAQNDLKGLLKTGELVGKTLRGGAIVGAAMAFERLAENAQKAAEQLGDKGTAEALRKLNGQIDRLKLQGTNVIGKVLGNVYSAFSNDKVLQLREQIDFLQRMQGRSFVAAGYDDIGTGFFTAAEGAAKLLELQQKLALYESSRPFGDRARAPGGRNRTPFTPVDLSEPKATSSSATKAPQFSAESNAYVAMLERMGEAQRHLADTARDAGESVQDYFNESLEKGLENLEIMPAQIETVSQEMTVFADEAARNMQSAFADFLFDPFEDGLKGMAAGFIDTIRRMVAEAAAAQILQSFFNWGANNFGGGVGSFFGTMAKSFEPRASGGPVMGGTPYMVGERGPEMFVPGSSGSIVPNHALGGGVTMNYSIDARGADAERIMAIMPGLLKQTKAETIAEVRNLMGRGRM